MHAGCLLDCILDIVNIKSVMYMESLMASDGQGCQENDKILSNIKPRQRQHATAKVVVLCFALLLTACTLNNMQPAALLNKAFVDIKTNLGLPAANGLWEPGWE